MTDQRRDRPNGNKRAPARRALRALLGAAALIAASFAVGAAQAAPTPLANDADIAAFAQRVEAYAGASRVRWVVAAATRDDAEALTAKIAQLLPRDDRPKLIVRINPQSFAESPDLAPGASIPVAWMAPLTTQNAGKCSWQVWVTDPSAPSATAGGVSVPLAPGDKLPVSSDATFRVGYSGLLQSKIYAFDETRPGAIRDLASAPDVNIPVAAGGDEETILLAIARQPAPFLEGIRSALAASAGQRRDLGKEYALLDKVGLNKVGVRSIGSNLQSWTPSMVVGKSDNGGAKTLAIARAGGGGELMETCQFTLTPARSEAQ